MSTCDIVERDGKIDREAEAFASLVDEYAYSLYRKKENLCSHSLVKCYHESAIFHYKHSRELKKHKI